MNSFEDRFYLENPSMMARIRRNGALLWMLFGAAIAWLTKGHRLRRALPKAQANEQAIVLEDWTD